MAGSRSGSPSAAVVQFSGMIRSGGCSPASNRAYRSTGQDHGRVRVATAIFWRCMITVFGYAAIGRTFFPKSSEFASLMLALLTFGVGF